MKFVFIMRNLLYLRNYGSTIAELARRGHDVVVGYEGVRSRMPREIDVAASELTERNAKVSIKQAAVREDWWVPFAQQVRWMRDYLRYLDPGFSFSSKCAARAESFVFPPFRRIARLKEQTRNKAVRRLKWLLKRCEEALPLSGSIREFIEVEQPDCIVVTPLLDFGLNQIDYVKVGRQLGIPTALGVASWDNLTNKGAIQICPDRVLVWNRQQAEEAIRFHGISAERISVTGAQLFDHWFERGPSRDRAEFCRQVGIDPGQPYVLYTCSSVFLGKSEAAFFKRWLQKLRAESDLQDLGVVIRPHPGSTKLARQFSAVLEEFTHQVSLFPAEGGYPVTQSAQDDYFDSIYHSAAVVGINTSAMLEAGIVGRHCLTVLDSELANSQAEMVHFAHLLRDGFLLAAPDFESHVAHLRCAIAQPDCSEEIKSFVTAFLRPNGLNKPATPILANELERLATEKPSAVPAAAYSQLVRLVALPAALYFHSVSGMRGGKKWIDMPVREWRRHQLTRLLTAICTKLRGFLGAVEDNSEHRGNSECSARAAKASSLLRRANSTNKGTPQ